MSSSDKVKHVLAGPNRRTNGHTCHWPGCKIEVPPAMWGCRPHWYSLPKYLRRKLWAAYVPGQEDTMDVSDEYLQVAHEIEEWIKENT